MYQVWLLLMYGMKNKYNLAQNIKELSKNTLNTQKNQPILYKNDKTSMILCHFHYSF